MPSGDVQRRAVRRSRVIRALAALLVNDVKPLSERREQARDEVGIASAFASLPEAEQAVARALDLL